jgi:TolA-binding protein
MEDKQYDSAAEEIMALVDENPSELFSLERRWLVEKIKDKLLHFVGLAEDEDQGTYDAGYDSGYSDAEDESETRIGELEQEIEDLQDRVNELEDEVEKAFAEGVEAGQRMRGDVESIELS